MDGRVKRLERISKLKNKFNETNDLNKIESINLQLPIKEIITNSPNYKLIIKDADGIYHYFHFDNIYDGWSRDLDEPIEINEN